MSISYSLNQGKKIFMNQNLVKEDPQNKNGAILFTTDTNELFINIGDVTDTDTLSNRKQVNALYATALSDLKDYNNNITIEDIQIIQKILGLKDGTVSVPTTLDSKMNKKNPRGSGNIIISDDSDNTNFDIKTANKNNLLIGSNLKLNTDNSTPNYNIISGQYNIPLDNSLFIIGNGTANDARSNAFSIIQNNNQVDGILSGNLYVNSPNATDLNKNNIVITEDLLTTRLNIERATTNEALEKLTTKPYIISKTEPIKDDEKKLLWIDTSSGNGNGILKYWVDETKEWKALSAVYA